MSNHNWFKIFDGQLRPSEWRWLCIDCLQSALPAHGSFIKHAGNEKPAPENPVCEQCGDDYSRADTP